LGRPANVVLLPLLFVYGMGCGTVLPSLLTTAMKSIPPYWAGAASGTYSTIQQTAVALGVSVCGGVFFLLLQGGHSYTQAYLPATALNICLLMLTGFFLWLLPNEEGASIKAQNPRAA
jgi:MFS family permease